LYMVMEFMPGGDLMTHLIRKDRFAEHEARFYTAELVEALDYIHSKLHYIHRDIKPDNILFDARGHIKLLDFGLCKFDESQTSLEERQPEASENGAVAPLGGTAGHLSRSKMVSIVGTPDYMAPEVYDRDYGRAVDFWSVGIILYEMLFGGPPFSDEKHDAYVTWQRVKKWEEHFHIPDDPDVSRHAASVLRGLINHARNRLTADQLRVHPFFNGLDLSRLRDLTAPILPRVDGPSDTQNFDDFDLEENETTRGRCGSMLGDSGHLYYNEYNFKRNSAPGTLEVFEQTRKELIKRKSEAARRNHAGSAPDSPSKPVVWEKEKRQQGSPSR